MPTELRVPENIDQLVIPPLVNLWDNKIYKRNLTIPERMHRSGTIYYPDQTWYGQYPATLELYRQGSTTGSLTSSYWNPHILNMPVFYKAWDYEKMKWYSLGSTSNIPLAQATWDNIWGVPFPLSFSPDLYRYQPDSYGDRADATKEATSNFLYSSDHMFRYYNSWGSWTLREEDKNISFQYIYTGDYGNVFIFKALSKVSGWALMYGNLENMDVYEREFVPTSLGNACIDMSTQRTSSLGQYGVTFIIILSTTILKQGSTYFRGRDSYKDDYTAIFPFTANEPLLILQISSNVPYNIWRTTLHQWLSDFFKLNSMIPNNRLFVSLPSGISYYKDGWKSL